MKRENPIRVWAVRQECLAHVRYTINSAWNRWDCQVAARNQRLPEIRTTAVRVELYDPAPSRPGTIVRRSR